MLLGLLPASSEPLTSGSRLLRRSRDAAGVSAVVATALVLCPPVVTGEARSSALEVVQYSVLGLLVPALIVVAEPARFSKRLTALAKRLSDARARHVAISRSALFLALEMTLFIAWRVPVVVDAIVAHRGLVALEAVTLIPAGVAFWLELSPSAPLEPRFPAGPYRCILAAVAMWTNWTMAYLAGFSGKWYPVYRHVGSNTSIATDQELATGLLWFAAIVVFAPKVFVDLHRWLTDDERPDAELRKLLREERRRERFAAPGTFPEAAPRRHRDDHGGVDR